MTCEICESCWILISLSYGISLRGLSILVKRIVLVILLACTRSECLLVRGIYFECHTILHPLSRISNEYFSVLLAICIQILPRISTILIIDAPKSA